MRNLMIGGLIAAVAFSASGVANAAVYLNEDNITVSVGAGTSPGTFNNTYSYGFGIEKVIDAPSADAS